jgi:nucleotide-binding universal stress UspA family protein
MVTAEPAFVFPVEEYEKAAAEKTTRILAEVRAAAHERRFACETVHVKDFPAEGIIATATAKGCDLIAMSSHGRRGLARALLGSQAPSVLTHTTIPVLICR